MKLSQAKHAIAVGHKTRRPVFMWGQPGIGKSDGVFQAATDLANGAPVIQYHDIATTDYDPENSFGLIDVRLSQCEPVDIRGLPMPDTENGRTMWIPPDWLPHTGRTDLPKRGILFLDEANGAPQSVLAAAYQLVLDLRIGNYALMPGWSIVLAGNRMTDGGVTFKMPKPLANRMIHIDVECDMEEFTAWCADYNKRIEVMAFIRFRPDLLNTFEEHVKKKLDGEAFATPRTWSVASDLVDAQPQFDVLMAMLNGTVGKGPAAEFVGFMQVWQKMPSIDGILIDPQGAPVPDDSATMYAVTAALANRAVPDNMDAITTYAGRLPPEFAVLTMKDTQRRNPACMMTKAFTQWANKNASLLG